MRRPPNWKNGDKITHHKLQAMTDAIRELQNRSNPVGRRGRRAGKSTPPPFYPTSIVQEPDTDPAVYNVRIQLGLVIDTLTERGLSDCITEYIPDMDDGDGGTLPMDDEDAVLSVPVGDYVYCRYVTTDQGVISETPKIQTSSSDEPSTHYQPPDALNSGVTGEYWRKLFRIVADGDSYIVEFFQQSDVEHYHEIPRLNNLGDGKEVFKQRTLDQFDLLTVKGSVDAEPTTSFTELDTLVEYDGGLTLEDATSLKVRAFMQSGGAGSGDTFIFKIWESDIYITSPYDPDSGDAPTITVDNGTAPIATFYVLDGVWHESQPADWPVPFNGNEHHVTYNTPDIGGP